MTTAVRRVRQEPLTEDGSESPGFTPSVASTSSDLSAKLGQLNIPKLIERLAEVDLEEEGRDEDQVLHSDEKLDIDSIQESLKPQPLATVEPTVAKEAVVQVNGGDAPTTAAAMARLSRNVSFNPETTIYEQVRYVLQGLSKVKALLSNIRFGGKTRFRFSFCNGNTLDLTMDRNM